MYAIVDIAGHQFKVEKNSEVICHRLEGETGATLEFEKVMLVDNDGKIAIGTPFVEGAMVSATILSHLKGDKVTIFKKKRRKSYQKATGHRQLLSKIQITGIAEKAAKTKKAKAEAETPAEPIKTEE